MMKRLLSILLALMLLCALPASLAEETVEIAAEPAAETEAPVLLATVNGKEIYSDNETLNYAYNANLESAADGGYDVSSEDLLSEIRYYSMQYALQIELIRQKAAKFGVDQITDEEKAQIEDVARAQWESYVQSYMESEGNITEESSDEDKDAARADAEAYFLSAGYTEESFVSGYLEDSIVYLLAEHIADYLTKDQSVTDEDVQAYFNDLVNEDKETYGNDAGMYEFYQYYYGQPSYYTPEGYRSIVHILLPVDEELMNNWKDLSARLEEQKEASEAEPTVTEVPETADETAETAEEPTPTPEPVTREMVDAAEKAILDSVQSTVDEIKEKLNGGASFDDLIKEYGTDPGMKDDATRAEGYAVHKDSVLWDPAFTAAAMALEKVGDISEPVVGSSGVHILQYLKDIAGGAVELTDEMKEEFRQTLTEEARSEALSTALDKWIQEETVFTEAGEAWNQDPNSEPEEAGEAEEPAQAEEAPEEAPAE